MINSKIIKGDIIMLEIAFWIFVGLIAGWNLIPQPEWIHNLYLKAEEKIKEIFSN